MDRKRLVAIMAVIIAAVMFGFTGVFSRFFYNERGIGPMEVTLIRVLVSAAVMLIVLGILARDHLRINRKDIPLMIAFGAFKMGADVTFFYSQETISLCLSTLLQMTAPYYVMLLSLVIFKEKLTIKKLICICIGTIGCIFVTGILYGNLTVRAEGILSAILSGVFIGLFTICGKVSNDRGIKPSTSLFYSMLIATLLTIPFSDIGEAVNAVSDPVGLGNALALGILITLVPYFLFVWSTQYIEPTVAIVISVSEVVTAAIVGFVLFDEEITAFGIVGMILIMASVVLMGIKFRNYFRNKFAKRMPELFKHDTEAAPAENDDG